MCLDWMDPTRVDATGLNGECMGPAGRARYEMTRANGGSVSDGKGNGIRNGMFPWWILALKGRYQKG